MKNILVISLIIYIIYIIFLKQTDERFTPDEMKNYSKMLKINCDKNTKLYNELLKQNKEKCNKKGATERETINNNTVCYDNIGKEIISKLDMESNCVMSNLINKIDNKLDQTINNQIINNQTTTKSRLNESINEGPDFINNWDTLTFDTKKAGEYSDINLTNPYIISNSLAPL